MKHANINLPYISIDIFNAIEPGSLETLDQLPAGQTKITSATTGQQVDLFFYVQRGQQELASFDADYVMAHIAKAVATAIKDDDLLNDGVGKPLLQIDSKHRDHAEALLHSLPFDPSLVNGNLELYTWIATHGQVLAKRLMSSVVSMTKPVDHPSHVMFALEKVEDGEDVGSICLAMSTGGRIRGDLYLGAHPEKAGEDDVGGMVMNLLKSAVGMDKNKHAVVFERQAALGQFAAASRTFTAVIDLPFPDAGSWFKEGALGKIINDAINQSLIQTVGLFGDANGRVN